MTNGSEPEKPIEGSQLVIPGVSEPSPEVLTRQFEDQLSRLRISPRERAELVATVDTVVMQVQKFHSGPLPPAEEFAAYGRALSTAPERILVMAEKRVAMAENQQQHDHRMESRALLSEGIYRVIGLCAGALLVAAMIGASAYCAFIGAIPAAVVLGAGGAITGVGGIFVRGRDSVAAKPSQASEAPKKPTAPESRSSQTKRQSRRR